MTPRVTTVTLPETTNFGDMKETPNQRISSDGISRMSPISFVQTSLKLMAELPNAMGMKKDVNVSPLITETQPDNIVSGFILKVTA